MPDAAAFDIATCTTTIRRDPGGVRLCNIDGCDRAHAGRGMCQSHLRQWRRTGHPTPSRIACTVTGCACGGRTHRAARVASPPREKRTPAPKPPGPIDWLDYDQLDAARDATGWIDQARCVGMPAHLFYPDGGGRKDYEPGISVCERCPVRYPCLAAHLTEPFGCLGGTMPTDRRAITKQLAIRRQGAA